MLLDFCFKMAAIRTSVALKPVSLYSTVSSYLISEVGWSTSASTVRMEPSRSSALPSMSFSAKMSRRLVSDNILFLSLMRSPDPPSVSSTSVGSSVGPGEVGIIVVGASVGSLSAGVGMPVVGTAEAVGKKVGNVVGASVVVVFGGAITKLTMVLPFLTLTILTRLRTMPSNNMMFAINESPLNTSKSRDNFIVTATLGSFLIR